MKRLRYKPDSEKWAPRVIIFCVYAHPLSLLIILFMSSYDKLLPRRQCQQDNLMFIRYSTDRCSRQIQFLSSIEGYALKGHMIKNLSLETVGDCKSECVREKRCVSINFGSMVCELNEHDHIQHPLSLTPWENFTYYYTEVRNLVKDVLFHLM